MTGSIRPDLQAIKSRLKPVDFIKLILKCTEYMFFWIKVQVKACFFTVCQQSVHHDVIEDLQVLVGFERFEKIEKIERFEEFERFDGLDKSGSTLRFELKGLKVWELLHSTFLF